MLYFKNHQQKINCLRINLPFLYHKYTHYFVHSCVIINILVFMIFHHRQSEELDYALRLINMIFVIIFGLDTLSKAFEKRSRILKKPTIIYQILVVLIAYINLILIATQPEQNPNHFVDQDHHSYRIFNAVSKALQFTLIIFVLKRNKKMKSVFKAIGNIIPIFLSMLTLIFLYMYIYAIIAMNIFSYLKPQMTVNGIDVHFRTFFKAM